MSDSSSLKKIKGQFCGNFSFEVFRETLLERFFTFLFFHFLCVHVRTRSVFLREILFTWVIHVYMCVNGNTELC